MPHHDIDHQPRGTAGRAAFRRAFAALLDRWRRAVDAFETDPPAGRFWCPSHRRLAIALLTLALSLSAIGLDGFSLPYWHQALDRSPQREVLYGRSRSIRSDDWTVVVPLYLAQTAVSPRLPAVNPAIGLGNDMHVQTGCPVAGATLLFRPAAWGFLVNRQFGVSFTWWARVFGLFYAVFLAAFLVTRQRFRLSVLSALAFLGAPYCQFWSFNYAEVPAYALFALSLFAAVLRSRSLPQALVRGMALGWMTCAFALTLYPPFQIAVAYPAVALAAGSLGAARGEWRPRTSAGGLVAAAVVVVAGLAAFWAAAQPAVDAVRHSLFPGNRFEAGGTTTLLAMFDNLWIVPKNVRDWTSVGNVCEAARFYYLFPPLIWVLLRPSVRRPLFRDPWFWPLVVPAVVLALWNLVQLPAPVAGLLQLSRVPPTRAQMGLGVINTLWIALYLSHEGRDADGETPGGRRVRLLGAGAFALVLALGIVRVGPVPGLGIRVAVGVAAVWVLLSVPLLLGRRSFLVGFAAMSWLMTGHFNPICWRSTDFLYDNPLSREIVEMAASDPDSRWGWFNTPQLGNLFRVLGVRSISGVLPVPQPALWAPFDPAGQYRNIYNRYAHVVLEFGPPGEARIDNPVRNTVRMAVDPGHPGFDALQVNYFVVTGPPGPLARAGEFTRVFEYAGHSIWARTARLRSLRAPRAAP